MSQPPKEPNQAKAIPKSLQEASDEFHMWIGHCIADWAATTDALFNIFWKALECSQEKAAIVFFRSPSLESRIALSTDLVENILPKTVPGKPIHPDLKAWGEIVKMFEDLKKVRTRLAHHPVATQVRMGSPLNQPFNTVAYGGQVLAFWFENYVSPVERLTGKHSATKPLVIGDLKNHHLSIVRLTTALQRFHDQRLLTYV